MLLTELKAGDRIKGFEGFGCIPDRAVRVVCDSPEGLYVPIIPLTKRDKMSKKDARDRPALIEVTPQMVEAAREVLHSEAGDDLGQIANEDAILRSMIQAAFAASPSLARRRVQAVRRKVPQTVA